MTIDKLIEVWKAYLLRRKWEQTRSERQANDDTVGVQEAEQALATLPNVSPLEALQANTQIVSVLNVQRWIAMKDAREHGATLDQIGKVLGVSRQSAWEFFQRRITEHTIYEKSGRNRSQPPALHVMVIGAGIGGLCLAQGLKKAGISVTVYERDLSVDSRAQGYRISVTPEGSQALYTCLPENLFRLYVATATKWTPQTIIAAFDHHLNQRFLKALPTPSEDDLSQLRTAVNRTTLREVLLNGLESCIHFGKAFDHFEQQESGQICAYFTDGTKTVGDVLVAADGTNSAIRTVMLPEARLVELGHVIYGKTPITPALADVVPPSFINGMTRISGPNGESLGIGAYQKREPFAEAAAKYVPSVRLTEVPDYLMWTVETALLQDVLNNPKDKLDPSVLHHVACRMVESWHPLLKQLIDVADIPATFLVTLRSSESVAHWQTTRVTLLGDAIHTMTPARGVGANTALRDAALLAQKLDEVVTEDVPLLQALNDYETEMLRYGFEAVAHSLQSALQVHQGKSLFGF